MAERTEVLLLDGSNMVIASSRPERIYTHFALHNPQQLAKGSYYDQSGSIVAFAKTLGYEDYDGLGWSGVIIQSMESDEALRQQLRLK